MSRRWSEKRNRCRGQVRKLRLNGERDRCLNVERNRYLNVERNRCWIRDRSGSWMRSGVATQRLRCRDVNRLIW